MIVADRKPMDEILGSISAYKRIILMGCGGCVTICFSGGAKAVEVLASQITMARNKDGTGIEITQMTPLRQCEHEYIDETKAAVESVDAVLSMACGVGVQAMAERYPNLIVVPALNTKFMGYPVQHGVWEERCFGCGDCVLEWTGGLCPIARCAKKILNGPCGGSQDGKCEVGTKENPIECVWASIHERLKRIGKLDNLKKIREPKDWRPSTATGQRKVEFEEAQL